MPRPFAYNPQTSPGDLIPGTIQYQDLAIGVDEQDYSKQPGGVVWWMGPDESNYIIAGPVPEGNHPTPVGPIGTVRFVKTANNSPAAFLMAVWQLSETHFPTVVAGYQWLVDNGFWTTFEPDRITIYTSGDFTILANPLRPSGGRLLAGGAYDTTFNIREGFSVIPPAGYSGMDTFTDIGISSIIELDSGSLLYFGNEAIGYNGIQYACVLCINRSGGIDYNFTGGFTLGTTTAIAKVNFAKKLSDGTILAAGQFFDYGGSFAYNIVKINQDGSRDLSWTLPEINGEIFSFTELSNGKIIVVGNISTFSGQQRYKILRLNTNGTVDETFAVPSSFASWQGGNPRVAVEVAGGKLIIAGDFPSAGAFSTAGIARLNVNGSIDTSFNSSGGFAGGFFVRYPVAGIDGGDGIILIAKDELAFSAYNFQTLSGNPIIKIKYSDATLDTTFSQNVSMALNSFAFGPKFITTTQDGTGFIVGGMNTLPITKFNFNGTKDTSFDSGVGFDKKLWYAQELSDGKTYTYTVEPARYNTQAIGKFGLIDGLGARILGFDANGFTGGYAKEQVRALDGDIIAVGTFTGYNGQTRNGIAKFEIDGTIASYANNFGARNNSNQPATISDVGLQSTGLAVIVGPFDSYDGYTRLGMARLTSNGSLEQFFYGYQAGQNFNFRFSTGSTFSQVSSYPTCLKIDANDKVIVGGAFTNWNNQIDQFRFIMRFNADGSRDTGWTYPGYLSGAVLDIETQSTGKIIAVGAFQSYGIQNANRIIRYETNGARDTTFNSGGTGFNNIASKVFIMPDNSLFVSGDFTIYNGTPANRIVKLTPNGAIDTSFVYGTGFNGRVEDIQLTSEGDIIMAGTFTQYNGVTIDNRIVKLSQTGEILEDFEVQSATNGPVYSILYRDPFE